ncbi:hypothetical protein RISK_001127 [Rhodopirellula islandica]|uniref:Uncharacterized protein n=1 Tax=Rhodopirellula islandica TaxID=595434 RepID=A0A0J1BK59_RHOIS|nr:hypothetical protein RISK_001127 [Rhodopirellula islandica]
MRSITPNISQPSVKQVGRSLSSLGLFREALLPPRPTGANAQTAHMPDDTCLALRSGRL